MNQPKCFLGYLLLFSLSFAFRLEGAEENGEWVRVPNKWLLSRFVRASTTAAKEYRVALSIPAGSNLRRVAPTIVKSSGIGDVDLVAADYARDMASNNGSLRDLGKAKELYFQLSLTPPALDINMRTEAGRRPIPAGSESSTPMENMIPVNNRDGGDLGKNGKMVVVFPSGGGYAAWAMVPVSTGNPGVDRYYVHTAVLDWQTNHKSSNEQAMSSEIGVRRTMRWESVGR